MSAAAEVRVVIADDHAEFRSALSHLLGQTPGIEVVAIVSTADDAVTASQRLLPHVAVLDANMPGGGMDAARRVSDTDVTVLLLTAHDAPEVRDEAAATGVYASFVKGAGNDLVQAVLEAARETER